MTEYECPRCGARKTTEDDRPTCDECGSMMRNVSLPRE